MKASDISDDILIATVKATQGKHGVPEWSCLWDIQNQLAAYHPKVVLAKLKSAIKRKLLDGCACGCRGDFRIIDKA